MFAQEFSQKRRVYTELTPLYFSPFEPGYSTLVLLPVSKKTTPSLQPQFPKN